MSGSWIQVEAEALVGLPKGLPTGLPTGPPMGPRMGLRLATSVGFALLAGLSALPGGLSARRSSSSATSPMPVSGRPLLVRSSTH